MLFDIVAGAIGRNPAPGLAAKKLVNGNIERLSDQVPKRQVNTADGIDGNAGLPLRHSGPIQNVPDTFDVEGVLADQQLHEMLFDDSAARRPADPVSLNTLVRGN